MPRKTKASPEDKVQIVEAYLRGEIGIILILKGTSKNSAQNLPFPPNF